MTAINRSIEREKARRDAGISDAMADKLQVLDGMCGEQMGYVESLCQAIGNLALQDGGAAANAHRMTIASLAGQAAYWSANFANELNSFTEDVGCNDISHGDAT